MSEFRLLRFCWRWLVRLPLLVYLALLLFGWFGAESMIFAPQPASYRDGPEILKLTTADGERISARWLTNTSARFTVLYSHGNAEDLGDIRPVLEELVAAGFQVLAYDYRGYGTSEGRPSERAAYQDIQAAYHFLVTTAGVAPTQVLLLGRSVGSGPAVDLAAREKVGGLIIQSGFTSAFRVMTHAKIAPFDRFDNLAKLPRVRCPVLIMHGTADAVIPVWHGQRLFAAAREPRQLVLMPGADHNDFELVAGPRYAASLRAFAASLR